MTIIWMDYTGRNGHIYPCLFSPKAVREHWKKGQIVTLEYMSAAGTVYFHIYPTGYVKTVNMYVRDRIGNVPVRHYFNGFRAESSDYYRTFTAAWWC